MLVEFLHETGIAVHTGMLTAAVGINDKINPGQFRLAENRTGLYFLNFQHVRR